MTLLAFLAATCGALLAAGALDKRLNTSSPTYRRITTWLLGPDDEPTPRPIPEPRSHVRRHCPFCGTSSHLHDPGCSHLDRLDAPRPKETLT